MPSEEPAQTTALLPSFPVIVWSEPKTQTPTDGENASNYVCWTSKNLPYDESSVSPKSASLKSATPTRMSGSLSRAQRQRSPKSPRASALQSANERTPKPREKFDEYRESCRPVSTENVATQEIAAASIARFQNRKRTSRRINDDVSNIAHGLNQSGLQMHGFGMYAPRTPHAPFAPYVGNVVHLPHTLRTTRLPL